jgi:hypothetical protein
LESVVSYTQGGKSYSVKLSEATPEQIEKIKVTNPEFFEKEKASERSK